MRLPSACAILPALLTLASCVPAGRDAPAPTSWAGAALQPLLQTGRVDHDPDDPAVWIHPTNPARSLILGTDKVKGLGGLYVFGLDGRVQQKIGPLDRPNNVDVEYGLEVAGRPIDIAVLTERLQHRLRVYGIPSDGGALIDLAPAGIPVLEGQSGEAAEPMGIALYKRPRDGAVFAIVSPKAGGPTDHLWQYRLTGQADGHVTGRFVRRLGNYSQRGPSPGERGEIEAIVVDDELGSVYYADESYAIREWRADPDAADAGQELAVFGTEGYERDREGLAVYPQSGGTGYIISTDQIPGASILHVFRREGTVANPHAHELVGTVRIAADETDGIEVVAVPLPGFPDGLLVAMNSRGRNFCVFPGVGSWDLHGSPPRPIQPTFRPGT